MSIKVEYSDSDILTLCEPITQGVAETQPATSNLAAGWDEENEYVDLNDAEDAFLELVAISNAGENQETGPTRDDTVESCPEVKSVSKARKKKKAVKRRTDTGSLPRSVVDMLNEEFYDWKEDYFGYKSGPIHDAIKAQDMFIKKWEREFAAYSINDSNWDTQILNYIKVCEEAIRKNKPRGVAEVLKSIILSRVSGEIADALQLKDLKVDEIVGAFNNYAMENNLLEMVVKDFLKVMNSDHQTLNAKEFANIGKFLDFIESKPNEYVSAFLVNVATKKEYQIDFDFFKDSSKDFTSFLHEYWSKAINLKAAKIKIESHPVFIGKVNKKSGKYDSLNHGLNGGPKFNEVVRFFRRKFAAKRIDNKLFTRIRNRYKNNLCVACGESRNHDWKSCTNFDLKQ